MAKISHVLVSAFLSLSAFAASGFAQDAEPRTLATVNGDAITEEDLVLLMQELPPQVQQQVQTQGVGALYPQLLKVLISQKLIGDKAREEGMDQRPEIAKRIDTIISAYLYGVYLEETASAQITDDLLQEEYQKTVSALSGEEIRVSHILVETEEEALEIVGLITEETAAFEDLARERSKDPGSGANGGDLGWARKGMFVPSFEEAAFNLQVNTFTDTPVQSQFGWHIIWVKEKRPLTPPPFEQVERQLRDQLIQTRAQAIVDEAIGAADVQRFDLNGDPLASPTGQ